MLYVVAQIETEKRAIEKRKRVQRRYVQCRERNKMKREDWGKFTNTRALAES
jgi:hypothetical protein